MPSICKLRPYQEVVCVGDRLHGRHDCPPELRQAQVPSFRLQPLGENTIKHAVGLALRPVTIRLSAQADGKDLVLSVEDDGPGEGAEPAVLPKTIRFCTRQLATTSFGRPWGQSKRALRRAVSSVFIARPSCGPALYGRSNTPPPELQPLCLMAGSPCR